MLSAAEQALVDGIEAAPILARTLDWAAVNSGTGNLDGLARVAGLLADAFAALPGEVTLVEPAPATRVRADGEEEPVAHGRHLLLRVRPDAARRVLLTGHMDTVYAADDPFQACERIDDDTVRGPGVADMKGGLSLMLAGLRAFEGGGPALGYDVLVNSDEETSSASSAALIEEVARGKVAALTYEPALAGGKLARARPGSGNFSILVRGRSAHAGRNPQDGRNALVAAADLAVRLAAAVRPGLAINPARIDGGGPNNRVPDRAVLRVNLRPAAPTDQAAAEALLAHLVDEVAARHEVEITLHGGFGRPPKPIAPATEALFARIRGAAGDLGVALDWADTGGVCDGNNIAAAGVAVIDTMGARGGAIHSPDEYLTVSSLAERARLTALVLHRLDREDRP